MAHYAFLNENNFVTEVIVGIDAILEDKSVSVLLIMETFVKIMRESDTHTIQIVTHLSLPSHRNI